jgi:hypothetical protein
MEIAEDIWPHVARMSRTPETALAAAIREVNTFFPEKPLWIRREAVRLAVLGAQELNTTEDRGEMDPDDLAAWDNYNYDSEEVQL